MHHYIGNIVKKNGGALPDIAGATVAHKVHQAILLTGDCDERLILPRTGYVVEPGIYIPGAFGIRSSIDLFLAVDGVHVTPEPPQAEIELIRK